MVDLNAKVRKNETQDPETNAANEGSNDAQ